MAGIYSQGGSAGHRYAGWLETVEAKNFQFGGKVFNGSPSAIYVGSNLVWANWLTGATKQAILGAFGQMDGMAVINATDAYLNQLAASGQAGKDKATALAGFINEDPMMVCSLGLEPTLTTLPSMPVRLLKGDGSAYIHLPIRPASSDVWEMVGFYYNTGQEWLFGARQESTQVATALAIPNTTKVRFMNCSTGSSSAQTTVPTIDIVDLKMDGRVATLNGATYTISQKLADSIPSDIYVFGLCSDNSLLYPTTVSKCGVSALKETGNNKVCAYCFVRNGVKGMIDVNTDTFYSNANSSGSFSIEYKIYQNGSWVTWTPSTP